MLDTHVASIGPALALLWGAEAGVRKLVVPMTTTTSDSASVVRIDRHMRASFVAYSDFITSLPDPHYRLRMPIRVVVDQDDDHYLVGDDVFMRYGVGSTVAEAKLDYSYALLDYYDELREDPDKLSPDLSRDLELLQGRITVTQS